MVRSKYKRYGMVIGLSTTVLCVVLFVLFLAPRAWRLSHPDLIISDDRRAFFAHVIILIDKTYSVTEAMLRDEKVAVIRQLIPNMSLGDTLDVYTIEAQFVQGQNEVYVNRLPTFSAKEALRDLVEEFQKKKLWAKPRIYPYIEDLQRSKLWEQRDNEVAACSTKVAAITRPPYRGCKGKNSPLCRTDLCAALRSVQAQLSNPGDRSVGYLFILSDLVDDVGGPRPPLCRNLPLPGVHVYLIYPTDSRVNFNATKNDWVQYFKFQQVAEVVPVALSTFANWSPVFPRTIISDLPRKRMGFLEALGAVFRGRWSAESGQ